MKNTIKRFLALAMVLTLLIGLLAGGGGDDATGADETKSPNFGAEQEIPWIDLDWEYYAADKVEWEFVRVGADGGKVYGTATEVVVERLAAIQNWDFGDGVYQHVYKGVTPAMYQELVQKLADNGQIITQYVDLNGVPSMDVDVNPNGSVWAVEGITSPDGRVLGKMGHSERVAKGTYKNIDGNYDMKLFESAVKYFKG